MKSNEALKLVGGLSKPSKMPGWAYGIPAAECKTGKKLQNVEGSTCYGCYALRAAMYLKLCRKHSTGAWAASGTHTGFEQ